MANISVKKVMEALLASPCSHTNAGSNRELMRRIANDERLIQCVRCGIEFSGEVNHPRIVIVELPVRALARIREFMPDRPVDPAEPFAGGEPRFTFDTHERKHRVRLKTWELARIFEQIILERTGLRCKIDLWDFVEDIERAA